jgi:hypothetical protein
LLIRCYGMILAGGEVYTSTVPNYVAYNFWLKVNFLKFDKYIENYINFYNAKSMSLE